MKQIFILLTLCIIIITAGCNLFNNPSGSDIEAVQVTAPTPVVGNAKSVAFKIVLPGKPQQSSNLFASIRATVATTSPTVTFKLTLINVGDTANPTTELKKIVAVDTTGAAQTTFSGVPAKTVIGEITIANGSIGGAKALHGALDLVAGKDNIVDVAPKGSKNLPDFTAEVLEHMISDKSAFSRIYEHSVERLLITLKSLDFASLTYDQALSSHMTYLDSVAGVFNGIVATPSTKDLYTNVTLELSDLIIEAVYGDGSKRIITPSSWVISEGGGILASSTFTALDSEGNCKLVAFYEEGGVLASAVVIMNYKEFKPEVDYQIDLGDEIKIDFMRINAGRFTMGQDDISYNDEYPPRTVTISKSFYFGKYEVTQEQYSKIIGVNPSYYIPTRSYADTTKQPVDSVNWYDAIRFCNKLSQQQGFTCCYTNQGHYTEINDKDIVSCNWEAEGFRLPTEAEWEYVCKSGQNVKYSWGDEAGVATIKENCWYLYNCNDVYWFEPHALKPGTQKVGTKKPTSWGIYDINGNVTEWCWDFYDSHYYSVAPTVDPRGSNDINTSSRICRGGALSKLEPYLRATDRNSYLPYANGAPFNGFRVVRTIH